MKPLLLYSTIFFLLLISTASHGQALEPLALAQRIFSKTPFPALERYSTGEYKGHPNGQDLAPTATTRFLLLGQNDQRAVVALTIQGADGKALDTYLHFQRDTVWKLAAFRALAMTGMIEQARQELAQMTPKQVDELIARAAKSKNKQNELITSRADYDFALGNCSLTLESDDHLLAYFRQNQAAFNHLRDQALTEAARVKSKSAASSVPVLQADKSAYRKLFLTSVHAEHPAMGTRLDFSIGGILDNTVGYYYVTDKQAVPAMNPDDVIMVREIGGGWYLYKTT